MGTLQSFKLIGSTAVSYYNYGDPVESMYRTTTLTMACDRKIEVLIDSYDNIPGTVSFVAEGRSKYVCAPQVNYISICANFSSSGSCASGGCCVVSFQSGIDASCYLKDGEMIKISLDLPNTSMLVSYVSTKCSSSFDIYGLLALDNTQFSAWSKISDYMLYYSAQVY